ncbi:MAG: hypothetical protein ACE5GV_17650 [Candidatus Scalindua sp.]
MSKKYQLSFPEEMTEINNKIAFIKRANTVYHYAGNIPVFLHHADDINAFRMYVCQLYICGNCKQSEMAKAFGISKISIKRIVNKYHQEGISGFFEKRTYNRKSSVMTLDILNRAQEMLNKGKTKRDIALKLKIKRDTLSMAIRKGKLVELRMKKRNYKKNINTGYIIGNAEPNKKVVKKIYL